MFIDRISNRRLPHFVDRNSNRNISSWRISFLVPTCSSQDDNLAPSSRGANCAEQRNISSKQPVKMSATPHVCSLLLPTCSMIWALPHEMGAKLSHRETHRENTELKWIWPWKGFPNHVPLPSLEIRQTGWVGGLIEVCRAGGRLRGGTPSRAQ